MFHKEELAMFHKDKEPHETIQTIQSILKRAGLCVIEKSWKHPAPGMWSVHVEEKTCPHLFSNGKGTTRASARASALAEFMERLNTGYFFTDYCVAKEQKSRWLFFPNEKKFRVGKGVPAGVLDMQLLRYYDPRKELMAEHLVDRMSTSSKIVALPFTRVRDEKTLYFPIHLLDNLYASNGMASGNTRDEAQVQALSEILERYVKFKIISKGITLPIISKRYYKGVPGIEAAQEKLVSNGFRVSIRDASLGGRFPVVAISIQECKTQRAFVAFGAHPSFVVALTRTMTELLQGQTVRKFHGLHECVESIRDARDPGNLAMHFVDSSGLIPTSFFLTKSTYTCSPVDVCGTRAEERDYLLRVFRKLKRDIYISEFPAKNFYTCRIVVPGLSEIYPVGDLVEANTNRGMFLSPVIAKLPDVSKKAFARCIAQLDEKHIGDHERVIDLIGVACEATSPWQQVSCGELRLLLLTVCKDVRMQAQLGWCLDSGMVRERVRDLYECCELILGNTNPAAYFSSQMVMRAKKFLAGQNVWNDLFDANGKMRGIKAHKKMCTTFTKARAMRTLV